RVKEKIEELFKDVLSEKNINELTTLVYYPEEKLQLIKNSIDNKQDLQGWYAETMDQLIKLISFASSKYTRSKLRKALPEQFVYIIEELLYKTEEESINKKPY